MIHAFQGIEPDIARTAFVHPAATLIGAVTIGEDSSIWPNVSLRGDVGSITIGASTSIQDNSVAHTTGGLSVTVIGSRVTVGHGVILHGCTIEDDCLIGMGSIVMDNAFVGAWSMVGAGSLIPPNKRYPGGSLILGRPARVVRELTEDERSWITRSWDAYVGLGKTYREASKPRT